MNYNAFKIIESDEVAPENGKQEVMSSVKSLVLVLRFVQLFLGDYSSVILEKFKSENHLDNSNITSKEEENG